MGGKNTVRSGHKPLSCVRMAWAGAAALTHPLARGDRAGAALISTSERLLAGHADSVLPVQARCAVDVSPAPHQLAAPGLLETGSRPRGPAGARRIIGDATARGR